MVKKIILISSLALSLLITSATEGITSGQEDDFENGTTQGWVSGSPNPNPPVNVSSGGSAGTGDNYLRMTSNGSLGRGGKLVAFNSSQWRGNYTASNIVAISANVKNFGASNLSLRLALRGPGGYVYSITGVSLPSSNGWQSVVFPVTTADLTGSTAVSARLADPNSSRVIMRIDQPQFNHNAGHLEFGPDGYMYIALGDGGGANDTSAGHGTEGNGQNINTVHGSILRIDPIGPGQMPDSSDPASANGAYRVPSDNPFVGLDGVDEIYAYGFRNPYRFSFDKRSGTLIVADVGQDHVEEIDIVHKGRNYGWNLKEGSFLFDPEGVDVGMPLNDPTLTDPVVQYDHDDGISVIGGHTYYGTEVPELWAQYVFGDFSRGFRSSDGRLLVADLFTGRIQELLIGATGSSLGLYVKGIGQDREGEVYVLASTALGPYGDTGVVLKVVSAQSQFTTELSADSAGTNSP